METNVLIISLTHLSIQASKFCLCLPVRSDSLLVNIRSALEMLCVYVQCVYVYKYCEHRFRETFYVLRSDDYFDIFVFYSFHGWIFRFLCEFHIYAFHLCLKTIVIATALLLRLLLWVLYDAAVLLMASHNCYSTNIYIYNINILIAMQQFPNSNIRYIFNVLLSEL